jgi:hypothetical protein
MGQLVELKRRWTILVREARDRGDLYAETTLTTFPMTLIRLAANQQPESEAQLEAMLDRRGGQPFNLQHSNAFDALIYLDLYRGDITRASVRLNTIWPQYARSLLFRIQHTRIQMLELRARCAVAMAERTDRPAPLLLQARRDAKRLQREGAPWALAHAHYVHAAIAACKEDPARAIAELTSAANLYDQADMQLNAQIMRFRHGEIEANPQTRAARESAETWMRDQGILVPARWAGMYAPGFSRISSESIETTF